MGDRLDPRPSPAPSARGGRRGGRVWAPLVLIAAATGLLAVGRAVRPATLRYRLDRIDRGLIRREVTVAGTVFTMTPDLSRVQARATLGEADAGRVAVGEAATLRCPASPDCVVLGTVSEVRLSPGGGEGVLVEADNHDHKLRPGMAATLSIEVAHREGVLRLPKGALSFVPPGMEPATRNPYSGRVFVLDHGQPRPVRVTVGLTDLRHAELVAGPLREGDAVIVEQE